MFRIRIARSQQLKAVAAFWLPRPIGITCRI